MKSACRVPIKTMRTNLGFSLNSAPSTVQLAFRSGLRRLLYAKLFIQAHSLTRAGAILQDISHWGLEGDRKCREIYIYIFINTLRDFSGGLGRIRTPDPLIRSQVLYPTELPVRARVSGGLAVLRGQCKRHKARISLALLFLFVVLRCSGKQAGNSGFW